MVKIIYHYFKQSIISKSKNDDFEHVK